MEPPTVPARRQPVPVATPGAGPSSSDPADAPRAECYAFDDFILDTRAESLLRNGKPVLLGMRSIRLLLALIERRDRVVGKEELMGLAWPRFTVAENNLPVAIFALRRALDDRPYIRSVYGQGYRFVGPVQVSARRLEPAPGGAPDLPSVAVLPFAAVGDAAVEQAHLGQGIAEDIRSELARNRWLTVIDRSSSSFGEELAPVSAVASQLGVRYVVEGTIHRSGGRVRISTKLSDAGTGARLLSERYERALVDLFDIQDEITASVVAAVRPVLHEAEEQRALRQHPASIDAWTAYQRGLWHIVRWADEDVQEARRLFQRAIDIDGRYAPGFHGMAKLFLYVGSGHRAIMPEDWQRRGEQFALRALALDGRDSEAHGTVALARHLRGDHVGALAAAADALQLNPNDASAHGTRGAALVFGGRPEEGIDAIQTCLRLSPRDGRLKIRHMHIGLGLFFSGDLVAAEAHAEAMMRSWPDYGPGHRLMAMALGAAGQAVRAHPFLQRAKELEPSWFAHDLVEHKPWYRAADLARVMEALVRAGSAPP